MNDIVERMKVISADEHKAILDYLRKFNFNYSHRELTSEEEGVFSFYQCWRYYGADGRYASISRDINDVHCIELVKLRTTSSGNCILNTLSTIPKY